MTDLGRAAAVVVLLATATVADQVVPLGSATVLSADFDRALHQVVPCGPWLCFHALAPGRRYYGPLRVTAPDGWRRTFRRTRVRGDVVSRRLPHRGPGAYLLQLPDGTYVFSIQRGLR